MKSTWLRISPLLLSLITLSSSAVVVFAHNSGDAALVSRGLRNLGNTCYMNAQLECAFHIPLVRDIILGHDNDNPDVQISGGAKALQNLFIDMEASAAAASAASSRGIRPAAAPITLCRTLGIPVMEQQDSQEFWKLLLPALKIPTLTDLYQGAYDDYITAVDGSGRERRREEPFLDLSVEVLTHANILDSISDMFGTPELLSETKEGNGWRPEKGAPKVDALKGSLLRVAGLPSLLQLHLKRFQYDYQYDTMSKINSRFAFPAELDLGEVCAGGLTEREEAGAVYDLQSIVVHIGEYGAGHYYSYVRPDIREDVWYRFDDDRVTEVSFQDVVKDAYGGRTVGEEKQQVKRGWFRRLFGGGGGSFGWGGPLSSAYMLQYVKRNEIEKLYCE